MFRKHRSVLHVKDEQVNRWLQSVGYQQLKDNQLSLTEHNYFGS